MMRLRWFPFVCCILGLVLGCDGSSSSEGAKSGSGDAAAEDRPESRIRANLAKLAESDRSAAERQRDCPVSGEALGSMGVPLKVRVGENDVWVCCSGCVEKLKANPDKFQEANRRKDGSDETLDQNRR